MLNIDKFLLIESKSIGSAGPGGNTRHGNTRRSDILLRQNLHDTICDIRIASKEPLVIFYGFQRLLEIVLKKISQILHVLSGFGVNVCSSHLSLLLFF